MTFSTIEIQVQEHQSKKYVDHKEDYVEKQTSFSHILWEYRVER